MSNPVMYQLRKAKKFTGTKKQANYTEVWQQFLPLYPAVVVNDMPVGEWKDIPEAVWATPQDAVKYNTARDYEYTHGAR